MTFPRTRSLLACVAVLAFLSAPAGAAILTLPLDFAFSGASPDGPPPYVEVTFDDGGTPGSVDITVDANNLVDFELVKGLYLNVRPEINPLTS